MDLKNDMKKYNVMHNLDALSNYYVTNEEKNDQILADFIHDKFDSMKENEIRFTVLKCLSEIQMKKILLDYEFKKYTPTPKKMTKREYINLVKMMFNRYHQKAGGYYFEDNEWLIYDTSTYEFSIKKNELLFLNTINKYDMDNEDTQNYLNNLDRILNNLASNIKVEIRYKDLDKNIIGIFIWCTVEK